MMKQRIKITTLGSTETGKTVLIKRFCEKYFEKRYEPTIGVDYGSITVARDDLQCNHIDKEVRGDISIDIFDTSGSDDFVEVRKEFYRDVDGILLVYDVNDYASFAAVDKMINEAKTNGFDMSDSSSESKVVIICGNRVEQDMCQVLKEDVLKLTKNFRNMFHFETSALSGHNVASAFNCLFQSVVSKKTTGK